MAAGKAQSAVHRLLDMVVEEVSLVDRAANQHRFLIVKRSEPMDQDTAAADDTTEAPRDTEPAPPDTDETVVDLNELPDDDGDGVVETKALDGSSSALILATQALEALTESVEVLGTVSEEEARARVAELARELHMVATRLGGAGARPRAAPSPTALAHRSAPAASGAVRRRARPRREAEAARHPRGTHRRARRVVSGPKLRADVAAAKTGALGRATREDVRRVRARVPEV